jgi:hypothetical protein
MHVQTRLSSEFKHHQTQLTQNPAAIKVRISVSLTTKELFEGNGYIT